MAAPQVVAATDLVMVLPARLAIALAGQLRLAMFEPPVEIPGFEMSMFWHDRQDSDPVHAFLRMEVAQVAAVLPKRVGGRRTRLEHLGRSRHAHTYQALFKS